jgi:hypothetical protein
VIAVRCEGLTNSNVGEGIALDLTELMSFSPSDMAAVSSNKSGSRG